MVIRREHSPIPGGTTWTGFGFMQTSEGSTLTFDVPAIFRYDISLESSFIRIFTLTHSAYNANNQLYDYLEIRTMDL